MTTNNVVAMIIGSLRKLSYNRKLATALISLAPAQLTLRIVEIDSLPFYNRDRDIAPPVEWTLFRENISAVDAIIFITPEQNRSIPTPVINALDIGSRPYGHNVWKGKPGAIIGISAGQVSEFGTNQHLRDALMHLDVPLLPHSDFYLGHPEILFDENGNIVDIGTEDFLRKFLAEYDLWITENNRRAHASQSVKAP